MKELGKCDNLWGIFNTAKPQKHFLICLYINSHSFTTPLDHHKLKSKRSAHCTWHVEINSIVKMDKRRRFLRFQDLSQCILSLPIHKPINQIPGHFGGKFVQFEELIVIPNCPSRTNVKCVRDALVLHVSFTQAPQHSPEIKGTGSENIIKNPVGSELELMFSSIGHSGV